MRKNINTEHIEGKIYQHTLELKTVQNQQSDNYGKAYIQGAVEVAVDNEGLNVIPVNFVFVTENTKKGGKNRTYSELMKIINEGKTWLSDGPDAATMVSIDTSLGLNDFVASDGTMVSQMVNQGGFLSVVSKVNEFSPKKLLPLLFIIPDAVSNCKYPISPPLFLNCTPTTSRKKIVFSPSVKLPVSKLPTVFLVVIIIFVSYNLRLRPRTPSNS
jgi:hypothetical protein